MWGWRLFEGYSSNMLKLLDQLNHAKLRIQQHPRYHFYWFVQLYIINGLVLGWWASIINRSFLFVIARWCGSFQSMIQRKELMMSINIDMKMMMSTDFNEEDKYSFEY
ncbi:hypothetical protein Dimus_022957 [Dionaea muscipula]